jgi:hypothetical protein
MIGKKHNGKLNLAYMVMQGKLANAGQVWFRRKETPATNPS